MPPGSALSARQSPPWTWCGDPTSRDFGCVFATTAADGAVTVSFDRAGRNHALTLFRGASLGATLTVYGRRFDVLSIDSPP